MIARSRDCGVAGYRRKKAMRKGAQLRYVRQLEKPTVFRKTLSISYIYICCKCLIFIKLYPFLEIRQLFVMSHLQVLYLGCKNRFFWEMAKGKKRISETVPILDGLKVMIKLYYELVFSSQNVHDKVSDTNQNSFLKERWKSFL